MWAAGAHLTVMDVDLRDLPHTSEATGAFTVSTTNPPSSLFNRQTIPENKNQMTQMMLWMAIIFSWMTVGWACSCKEHGDKHYCKNDFAFRGKPVAAYSEKSVYYDPSYSYGTEEDDPFGDRIFTVQVDEVFWSKSSSVGLTTVNITTPKNNGLCGVAFNLNTSYVIAASYEDGKLATYLCSGNTIWDRVDKKRKEFFKRSLRKLCA